MENGEINFEFTPKSDFLPPKARKHYISPKLM